MKNPIVKKIKNQLRNLKSLSEAYEAYNLREIVKMFEQSIKEELNFSQEVNNQKYFSQMFRDNSDIHTPALYEELCTDRIICMEFIDGYKITDLEALKEFNITGEELAKKGINLYFEQVFEHGFFHADPHPGNIFVLKNGKIVFIDYGMMGSVIESDKVLFTKMLLAMYDRDVNALKKTILKFSNGLDRAKEQELEYDIGNFFRKYTNQGIEDINPNEAMESLNALLFDYKVKIPANLLLLIKALCMIEGIGLTLDPKYDIIENIGPYAKRLLKRHYDLQKLRSELLNTIDDGTSFIKGLPDDLKDIIQKIKEGKLHIEFEHKGIGPFLHNMDTTINRISFTLIVVALIIASSIIILAKIPPLYQNASIMGLIGLGISALLAFRLLYSIMKHGNF